MVLAPVALLWLPLLRLLLLPQLAAAEPTWSYVSLFDGNTESADWDQNVNRLAVTAGDTSTSNELSVRITQLTGETKLREEANMATAGRTFIERARALNWARSLTIYAVEDATVTVTEQGGSQIVNQAMTAGSVQTFSYSTLWATDVVATGDIVGSVTFQTFYAIPLLPPANVIFGMCTTWCTLANPGGTAMTIRRVCTDGSVSNVNSNNAYLGVANWDAPVCRYEAPTGQGIVGHAEFDGSGLESQSFISTSQFQARIVLPLPVRVLLIMSDYEAKCAWTTPAGVRTVFDLSGYSEVAGGPGVYSYRFLQAAGQELEPGTRICCDTLFGATAETYCGGSPSCTNRETNFLAMAVPPEDPLDECLPTTTTSTSSTSMTTSTTSTTSISTTTTLTTSTTTSTTSSSSTSSSSSTTTSITSTTTSSTTVTTSTSTTTTNTGTTLTGTTLTGTTTTPTTITQTTSSTTTTTSSSTTTTTTTVSTTTSSTITTSLTTSSTTTGSTTSTSTNTQSSTTATRTTATTATATSVTLTTTTRTRTTTTITTATISTTTVTSSGTSTTTTTPEEQMPPTGALLFIARKWEERELENLLENGGDNISFTALNITTVVVRLTQDSLAPVTLGNTGIEVSVPGSLFGELGLEELIVTATGFGEQYLDRMAWPSASWESEGGAPLGQGGTDPFLESLQVKSVMHLSVPGHAVRNLSEPISINTGVNASEDVECAYWDEEDGFWSSEGVTTEVADDGTLVCMASHLSLFGAILRGFLTALACSQVTLLRADAFRELGRGEWTRLTGSYVLWGMLSTFSVLMITATALDCRRSRTAFWKDEHFLIVDEEEHLRLMLEEEEEEEDGDAYCKGYCWGCCDSIRNWCKDSNALRDALDEIASAYWKHFGEFRDLLEALAEGVQCRSGRCHECRLISTLQAAMRAVMANSAQRQAAAAEGISADFASFAMEDDDLHTMLVKHHVRSKGDNNDLVDKLDSFTEGLDGTEMALEESDGIVKIVDLGDEETASTSGGKSVEKVDSNASAAKERALAWAVVLDGLHKQTHHYSTVAARYRSLPSAVCRLLLWQHPAGICFLRCIFLTSKMRVLLFLVDSMGSVMLGTVFFTTSGTVPSKKNRSLLCETLNVGEAIGRLLAIAVASVIISSIPAMFLASLCTRGIKKMAEENSKEWKRQLLAWKIQDVIIYVFGFCYLTFCFLFICLFLANTEPEDQAGWVVSILLSLLLDNVVIPLAVAIAVPFLAAFFLSLLSCVKRATKKQILDDAAAEIASKQNMTLPVVKV